MHSCKLQLKKNNININSVIEKHTTYFLFDVYIVP